MKRTLIIFTLIFLTSWSSHAAGDIVASGVVYHWSNDDLGYVVTGWDGETPIQSLHIRSVVDDMDVVGICAGAFEDNEDIVFLTIDEGITYIGQNAFCRCYNLDVAILPEGLETIEEEAFAFCTKLKTMAIPSTVKDIQAHAFSGCTGVTDVYFLMDADQLDTFAWWDGVYPSPGEENHGGMEFNESRLAGHNPVSGTRIHVPIGLFDNYYDSGKFEAWLIEEDDNCYPLWWIVNYGVVGREYTVCDDLTGIYVDVNGDLYAKDDEHWLMPDRAYPGEVDYMKNSGLLKGRGDFYDQSNWVLLKGLEYPDIYKMYRIQGASVTGILEDKRNPVITVSSTPVKSDLANYVPNTYVAASVMERTQVIPDGRIFAFVRPKPQEVAYYEWSVYFDNDEFYLPATDMEQGINRYGIKGGFAILGDLYEEPPMPDLVENGYYPFHAISRYKTSSIELKSGHLRREQTFEPYLESGLTPWYDIFPLKLPEEPVITAVTEIDYSNGDKTSYYDIFGRYVGFSLDYAPRGIYVTGDSRKIVK